METQQKQYEDDDGRVICNMDVAGMRWHDRAVGRQKKAERKLARGEQMTRSETLRFTWYSVLSGMVIALVFSAVWVLIILFCTQIWFR